MMITSRKWLDIRESCKDYSLMNQRAAWGVIARFRTCSTRTGWSSSGLFRDLGGCCLILGVCFGNRRR